MEHLPEALAPGRVTIDALDGLYATGHWLYRSRARYMDASAVFRVMVLCLPDEERGYLALGACHEGLGQEAIALELYNMATLSVASAPRATWRGRAYSEVRNGRPRGRSARRSGADRRRTKRRAPPGARRMRTA